MANLSPVNAFSVNRPLLFLITFLFLYIPSIAQERCGTVPYIEKLKQANLIRERTGDFEQWLSKKNQHA